MTSSVLPAQRNSTAQLAATVGRVVLIGGLALAALTVLWSTFRVIPAGHVGVATFFGKVQKEPLREGLNMIHSLLSVTTLSTQVHKRQARYDAASKDLQAVHVEMVLNYRLLPDRAPDVYQKIGTDYASIIVDPAAQEALKANTALHIASEILRLRPKIKSEVQANLMEWLDKYGIELQEVALANIEFDPSYQKAIEAKQIEEQKAEQKLYELVQAQRQADIATAQAKGQGEAARAREGVPSHREGDPAQEADALEPTWHRRRRRQPDVLTGRHCRQTRWRAPPYGGKPWELGTESPPAALCEAVTSWSRRQPQAAGEEEARRS